jgi:hypothetical protein
MSSAPYVRITAARSWTIERVHQAIERAKTEAVQIGTKRIFFDLQAWDRPSSQMVRFDSGLLVSELLDSSYRIAALARKDVVNYFAETVAANRGANLKVFTDEGEALAWLQG